MSLLKKLSPLFLLLIAPAAFAAMDVSIGGLLSFIIYIVIIGLVFWAIWWFISYVGLPEPFNKIVRVVIGLVALIVVISLLLNMAGMANIHI